MVQSHPRLVANADDLFERDCGQGDFLCLNRLVERQHEGCLKMGKDALNS